MQSIREVEPVRVSDVYVADRLRQITDEAIATMAASMEAVGLLTPITVRVVEMMEIDGQEVAGVPILIAGATRLAAAKRLGWEVIDTLTADVTEVEARKHEIAENLHRSELTVAERAEHVAEWARLTGVSGQVVQKLGRPEGGISAASRELGLGRKEVERAVKVASISEPAKQAAINAHLDNNQSALLKIAASQPAEQVEKVRELAAERDARRARRSAVTVPLAAEPISDDDAVEKQLAKLNAAWNAAGPEARQRFRDQLDAPIMDRRHA
ncbi:ParB/RepB/Spo0J family partition protein [Methylorubrum rhodesianum]|uniref:ParB/RepB/Spo0J family partition protein n=1 Tax=Methylorubrum rhodesianum TaxID=29427 RepID=UPI003D0433F1